MTDKILWTLTRQIESRVADNVRHFWFENSDFCGRNRMHFRRRRRLNARANEPHEMNCRSIRAKYQTD